jgi:hypothetical protein
MLPAIDKPKRVQIERPKQKKKHFLSSQLEGGEDEVDDEDHNDGDGQDDHDGHGDNDNDDANKANAAAANLSKEELEQIASKIAKLQETQKSMQLANKSSFKSIATVVEELKAEVAALKARPTGGGHGSRHHSSGKLGSTAPLVEDPEAAIEDMLLSLKASWNALISDIAFGLDYLSDKPKTPDNGMLSEVTAFIDRIDEFVKHLDFGAGHSASELLIDIHPVLDELTLKALHILRLDEAAQNATRVSLCLGDILCENEQPNLREKIIGCLDASVEALDSKLNKIDLRRRLDNLEIFVQSRAAESYVDEINQNLRSMISLKADMSVVEEITSTMESIKDLRRLMDRMINQLDDNV